METLKLKDEINLKSFIDLKVNGILSLRKKKLFTNIMQKRLDHNPSILNLIRSTESCPINENFINNKTINQNNNQNFTNTIIKEYYDSLSDAQKIQMFTQKLSNPNYRNDVLSALQIINEKIIPNSANIKIKRMLLTDEKLPYLLLNYLLHTDDYYIMLISSSIFAQLTLDYIMAREIIYDNDRLKCLNNQIRQKFAQCTNIIQNIFLIYDFTFSKNENFKSCDIEIVNTIIEIICNIIVSNHFINGNDEFKFSILWNLSIILRDHYSEINLVPLLNIIENLVNFPVLYSRNTHQDSFSEYLEILTFLSNDNKVLETNNYYLSTFYLNKIFPFLFNYTRLNSKSKENERNSNPALKPKEVLISLVILNNIMKNIVEHRLPELVSFTTILEIIIILIDLYRLQTRTKTEVPLQLIKFLSYYSSLNNNATNEAKDIEIFTMEVFTKLFTYYTREEESLGEVINMIENVLKYQKDSVVTCLLLQTNFVSVISKGLVAIKSETKIITLNFICFLYEFINIRKIKYIEINIEFEKHKIFEKLNNVYLNDKNTYICQQAKGLIEYIELNQLNKNSVEYK